MSDKLWSEVKNRMDDHSYMGEINRDEYRVKVTAEVFTPNDKFTWRMMKYAVTTRNDPMTLPAVSTFIGHRGTNHKDLRSQGY